MSAGSWKCTKNLLADWILPGFDDSAWPAALVETMNGNRSVTYHAIPVAGVHDRAWWIWSADATLCDYVYCRFHLPPAGSRRK